MFVTGKWISAQCETNSGEGKMKCGTALKRWDVPCSRKAHTGSHQCALLTWIFLMARNWNASFSDLVLIFICCSSSFVPVYRRVKLIEVLKQSEKRKRVFWFAGTLRIKKSLYLGKGLWSWLCLKQDWSGIVSFPSSWAAKESQAPREAAVSHWRRGELLRFPSCWQESEVNSSPSEGGGCCKTQKGEKWIHLSLSHVKSPRGRVSIQAVDLPGTLPENHLPEAICPASVWGLKLLLHPCHLLIFLCHSLSVCTALFGSATDILDIISAAFVHSGLINPVLGSQLKCSLLHFLREQY